MITRKAKYISYDDNKFKYRVVLQGEHIGYYATLEEAARIRNIWCVKLGMKVPDDVPDVEVPVTVTSKLEPK